MERVKALISKLHEQSLQGADAAALMATVQLLQSELANASTSVVKQFGSAKVAVVLPSNNNRDLRQPAEVATASNWHTETEKISNLEKPDVLPISKKEESKNWQFDPVHETPTLAAQQQAVKELNDHIGNNGTSLNDRLKIPATEIADALIETPIKDLKKAIGINDRYVFVSELFRGDDAMYERSIKTINNFHIFQEAQYWMERELKIKLAWDDAREITQQFYQLVKRRFS
jgi:hypothetical protein